MSFNHSALLLLSRFCRSKKQHQHHKAHLGLTQVVPKDFCPVLQLGLAKFSEVPAQRGKQISEPAVLRASHGEDFHRNVWALGPPKCVMLFRQRRELARKSWTAFHQLPFSGLQSQCPKHQDHFLQPPFEIPWPPYWWASSSKIPTS